MLKAIALETGPGLIILSVGLQLSLLGTCLVHMVCCSFTVHLVSKLKYGTRIACPRLLLNRLELESSIANPLQTGYFNRLCHALSRTMVCWFEKSAITLNASYSFATIQYIIHVHVQRPLLKVAYKIRRTIQCTDVVLAGDYILGLLASK